MFADSLRFLFHFHKKEYPFPVIIFKTEAMFGKLNMKKENVYHNLLMKKSKNYESIFKMIDGLELNCK